MSFDALLSIDNEVFRSFLLHGSLTIVKTLCLAPLSAIMRRKKGGGFKNVEDARFHAKGDGHKIKMYMKNDKDVERVKKSFSPYFLKNHYFKF